MNYSTMTVREVEIELSTNASEGLSSFEAHDRLIDNGRNLPEKVYTKSVFSVALSQLTNLYTIAFIVMGVILALFDSSASRLAQIIFFAVAVVNMVSGFLRDYGERKNAVNFDKMRSGDVKIKRDGKEMTTDPTLLVKGDIVLLEKGDFVPCDLRIMECEGLKADESIFKGRNTPCDKHSDECGDEVDAAECKNILYCGSVVAAGSAVGAVIHTGKDTLLARINARCSKKLDMHDKFGKNADSEKMLTLLAIAIGIFVLVFTAIKTKSFSAAMVQSCTVAMCLLPAPCCIVRMLGELFCNFNLKRENVRIENGDFVYDIGMSEYFLFDKGGLMTDGGIRLEERVVSDSERLSMAVICSDCELKNGKIYGNEMDKATAEYLMDEGYDIEKLLFDNKKLAFMPFDEKRMLMASVSEHENGYRLIVKGSVESIPTLCVNISDGDEILEMTGEMLHRLEQISSSMAEKGLKIRVVAYKDIDYVPENIENEIKALTFVGILGYRELLTKGAKQAVEKLERVYVKPIMVTGDHRITASAFAESADLIKKEDECISFHELGECSDSELMEACDRYKVFASATSNDRERLMRVLSQSGKSTLVAGEGMTSPSSAMYASASFGDESMTDCDVIVEKSDIDHIAEVIYKSRCTRGNLAYASMMAISVGFAEVLWMIFTMLTGGVIPSVNSMILVNIFVVFVPSLIMVLFATVYHRLDEGNLLAVRCALSGVLCAVMCILAQESIISFTALYAAMESLRLCASYNNLEKGRWGIVGIILSAITVIGVITLTGISLAGVICALIAVMIGLILPFIRIKGMK